ncbi:MAG: adenylate kinase [Rikenellaceae bacterium]
MLNIVLFGAPGCGKGTQAAKLKEKYGVNHVSTGEVIRGEINRGTELGKSMSEYIEAGKLAPDQIVIDMIANYVVEHKEDRGNIFDGFPRTTAQAEAFDKILEQNNDSVDIMIYMEVPEEELVKRILLRGKDSGRADDASEDVIRNRISVYNAQTAIVADYYTKQNKYAAIDGLGSMDEVFDRISEVVDAAIKA